jgi:hypothetical protein
MGSTIINKALDDKGAFGKQRKIPAFLQFVPGHVVEVVCSQKSLRAGNESSNINTIIAKPNVYNEPPPMCAELDDDYRYKPLLRGITEVPAKGDPVLLCTFGDEGYYLGPLNTANNVNWNDDVMYRPEFNLNPSRSKPEIERLLMQESLSFDKLPYNRLIKLPNEELDVPESGGGVRSVNETHGDIIFEGRHGNSIRIGSRAINPYIFISNGRQVNQHKESLIDGSLISITERGSLTQHFSGYKITPPSTEEQSKETVGFILSSDNIELENRRGMGNLIQTTNVVDDVFPLLYEYSKNQILFRSDRITIDSRHDDIYLSSFKDIHIGTGRNMTMSTKENLIIESKGIFLGDPNLNNTSREMEPMVLGNVLLSALQDIIALLREASSAYPAPLPLVDPLNNPLSTKLASIETKINQMLSKYHYIEPNAGDIKD